MAMCRRTLQVVPCHNQKVYRKRDMEPSHLPTYCTVPVLFCLQLFTQKCAYKIVDLFCQVFPSSYATCLLVPDRDGSSSQGRRSGWRSAGEAHPHRPPRRCTRTSRKTPSRETWLPGCRSRQAGPAPHYAWVRTNIWGRWFKAA